MKTTFIDFVNKMHVFNVIRKRRPDKIYKFIKREEDAGRVELLRPKDINKHNINEYVGMVIDRVDKRKTSDYIKWREEYGFNYYDIIELPYDPETKMTDLHIPVPKVIRTLSNEIGYEEAIECISKIPRSRTKFRDNKFFESRCDGNFFKCWKTSHYKANVIHNYVEYKDRKIIELCLNKPESLRYIFSIPEWRIDKKKCNKCKFF
jgi:hypothetical protein